jgi:hypothetical protein
MKIAAAAAAAPSLDINFCRDCSMEDVKAGCHGRQRSIKSVLIKC